jgi:TM2 domain-containing membrane protein YozV
MASTPPPLPTPEYIAPKLNIGCPYCKVQLAVHPSQAGSIVECPNCHGKFQLPIATANTGSISTRGHQNVPAEIQEFSNKKIPAGILGILLGCLGIHKFILGLNTAGVIMLVVSIVGLCFYLPTIVMGVIGLVEGIIYLTKSDEDFYQAYAVQKKEWF